MKKFLRKFIGNHNPLLLFYHRLRGMVAHFWYRNPTKKMIVVGVTGTDGKTTTVNLIADMLAESGVKVGMMSTLRYRVGDKIWSNKEKMTTSSPFNIQKKLRMMADEGCEVAIVEVTSHSVVQSRIWGINFDVAVFTNLTADHIEYHGSHEAYMAAKGQFIGSLFGMRRKNIKGKTIPKVLVLNEDDQYFDYYNSFEGDRKLTFGLEKGQYRALKLKNDASGIDFELKLPNGSVEMKTNLLGRFNAYNILASFVVGVAIGVEPEKLADAYTRVMPVPGRFEPVNVGQDFNVVVDFAHTQFSLEKLCQVFKPMTEGRLILVFGSTGGGRDKARRPIMGQVADHYADIIVLTNDDPYHEDQEKIIEDIAGGVKRKEGATFAKIVDRTAAVEYALSLAKAGDTVLIAGKGGEEVIVIGDEKIPYDDREVVREYLTGKIFGDVSL